MTESKNPRLSEPERFDAGILNGFGGGNTEYWFTYIRGLLENAHEFYVAQFAMPEAPPAPASQLVSAPAEKKEWVTAEDIRTVSSDVCEGFCVDAAKDLSEILAPRIEAHIAAAYKDAAIAHTHIICDSDDADEDHAYENGFNNAMDLQVERILSRTPADAARALELAEVRAAVKEAEWWDHDATPIENCLFAERIAALRAREAELLARGGGK